MLQLCVQDTQRRLQCPRDGSVAKGLLCTWKKALHVCGIPAPHSKIPAMSLLTGTPELPRNPFSKTALQTADTFHSRC